MFFTALCCWTYDYLEEKKNSYTIYIYIYLKKISLNFWVKFSLESFREILFTALSCWNNSISKILYIYIYIYLYIYIFIEKKIWAKYSRNLFGEILINLLSKPYYEIIPNNILSEISFKYFGSELFYTKKYKIYTVYIYCYSASL